jgi:hypothetical protein
MFLGLLDPDPDPSLYHQKNSKKIGGFGCISERHGSADPDPDPEPHQNVMDPQH